MTPWDQLVETLDQLASGTGAIPDTTEATLADLIDSAKDDRAIDRELRTPETARWMVGLALGQRALRERASDLDADDDAAHLRMIMTRWLHPARPRS